MSVRKLLGLAFASALSGALLAVVVPVRSLAAEKACVCNDWGDGDYACQWDQKACEAGNESCQTTCTQ